MVHILLPVYNEEGALPLLLEAIKKTLERGSTQYSVVIVNDGSTDASLKVAENYAGLMPVNIVNHGENKGLGVAIKSGIEHILEKCSDGDSIVTMDADNSHDPALIPLMLLEIEKGADVVIASRFVKGGSEIGLSVLRRMLSRGFGFFIFMLGMKKYANDMTCGYRAYSSDILRKVRSIYGSDYITSHGFVVMFELLFKLHKLGATVAEIPLVLRYDKKIGKSKIKIAATIAQYMKFIVKEALFQKRAGDTDGGKS